MLDIQYRMVPCLSKFSSINFYDKKLKSGENVRNPEYVTKEVKLFLKENFNGKNLVFIDIRGRS